MISATADEVRRLMRQGFDTVGIAGMLNAAGLFEGNQGRAWREPDVWNLLAREGHQPALVRHTWAYGLRVAR
jgi:hypothetical protein